MTSYVLIAGTKRQGKDTFAEMLQQEICRLEPDAKVNRAGFADPMKEFFASCLGFPTDIFHDQSKKEVHNDDLGMTPRLALQLFGSEVMKPFLGDRMWCEALVRRQEDKERADWVIVTDVRFEEELEFFSNIKHSVVYIHRDWQEPKRTFLDKLLRRNKIHASEKGLYHKFDSFSDIWVDNSGTMDQLRKQAKKVAEDVVNAHNYVAPDWI